MKLDAYDANLLERVREVCQQLFHGNYITEYVFAPNDSLKKANESYFFIMAHYDAIEELLDRCGWTLCHDSRSGVLYLDSHYAQAKVILTKTESYFLLALRLIYDEKKIRASASGEVFITVRELIERVTTLGAVNQITRQDREKSLRTLAARHIITRMTGTWGDLDARLAVLPSVICAVSAEKTKAVLNALASQAEETLEEEDEA